MSRAITNKERYTVEGREWVKLIREKFGDRCAICGSDWNTQVHHIVPITFRPEFATVENNGILLCAVCHNCAHGNVHYHPGGAAYGRPQKYKDLTDQRRIALNAWARHEIGTKEAKALCGMTDGCHITDAEFYREWLASGGAELKRAYGRNGRDITDAKRRRTG